MTVPVHESGAPKRGWQAQLELGFTRRADRTLLTRNQHQGPLQVQKALYPEGEQTCHVIVLHPPGGIAAGDELRIRASLADRSGALLTTPGATKWYRSEGPVSRQNIHFSLAGAAVLEWLPRENIVFDGSRLSTTVDVALSADAKYFGWDILCFGRRASGESWLSGRLHMQTQIRRADRIVWSEVANIDAHSGFALSPVGLAGCSVCGTFIAAGFEVSGGLLARCRELQPARRSRVGLTRVPGVLIARYLGDSTEDAFQWFTKIWEILRPAALGRRAHAPRVWAC